jgi:hypothetical protein
MVGFFSQNNFFNAMELRRLRLNLTMCKDSMKQCASSRDNFQGRLVTYK